MSSMQHVAVKSLFRRSTLQLIRLDPLGSRPILKPHRSSNISARSIIASFVSAWSQASKALSNHLHPNVRCTYHLSRIVVLQHAACAFSWNLLMRFSPATHNRQTTPSESWPSGPKAHVHNQHVGRMGIDTHEVASSGPIDRFPQ